jgi:superfamily II DNA or RNA helicase
VISDDLARLFRPVVRRRGAQYLVDRAVTQLRLSDGVLRATVNGNESYSVEVELVEGRLRGACSCPYARDHRACKHLWATILEAERRGELALLGIDPRPRSTAAVRERGPSWRRFLEPDTDPAAGKLARPADPGRRSLRWVIDVPRVLETGQLVVEVLRSSGAADASSGTRQLRPRDLDGLGGEDRALFNLLHRPYGERASAHWYGHPYYTPGPLPSSFEVPADVAPAVLTLAARDGGLRARTAAGDLCETALAFDDGAPWQLGLVVEKDEEGGYAVRGTLQRGDERADLSSPLVLTAAGWVVFADRVVRLDHGGLFPLVARLRGGGPLTVPAGDGDALVARLSAVLPMRQITLPPELALEEREIEPASVLALTVPRGQGRGALPAVLGAVSFSYGGESVPADDVRPSIINSAKREVHPRRWAAERAAADRLRAVGFRPDERLGLVEIPAARLSVAVRALVADGWRVEANGKPYRRAGGLELAVSSGIDWFDLRATLTFDDVPAPLPALLAAARGDGVVRLGDGSFGLLPEDWLARHGLMVKLGEETAEGALRFRRGQAALLDLLLADASVEIDETFARARRELAGFERVVPCRGPRGFSGELRPYQALGVAWMQLLRRLGLGGCLADDMGLGKTVQLLAVLAGRRAEGVEAPSLIVVPKSLVSNWLAEAARFAPRLRVLPHVGIGRPRDPEPLARYDVVLTTYGTLKRDVGLLADVAFDYVVLDEAQAIKNAASQAARAARVLRGSHRLALTGTPVENHLGELWSLFQFLAPGLLGRLGGDGGGAVRLEPDEVQRLARGLRPFILRRTKAQVAPELPPKHEETLVCDMAPPQRRAYGELRDHFRRKVLDEVDRGGMARARMHVLEALLRLRQVACHPALVDRRRAAEPSAKLDVLLARLGEVVDEGHKALVFSQFTSLLALVRTRLDDAGVTYEYLDGKTRDRAARVARFQGDADCRVFLLSLKAGGVGLNLTAADYVFILDPWWNPAVEAQAVDRAHRIGQSKRVFAYRLLCRDTVEEKIAALQESKRGLAEAIVTADEGFLRRLDRRTLEELLS